MRKFWVVATVFGAFGLLVGLLPGANVAEVEARPQYSKVFKATYAEVKKVDCNVCHVGKDKKDRNEYGKALAACIDKNCKDEKKIVEALEKVAAEKVGDKTWGELFKSGKRPDDK